MKVRVDAERCTGHAIVALPDVPTQFQDAVRQAVEACPEDAIELS